MAVRLDVRDFDETYEVSLRSMFFFLPSVFPHAFSCFAFVGMLSSRTKPFSRAFIRFLCAYNLRTHVFLSLSIFVFVFARSRLHVLNGSDNS
jgi:hypothetical protein